MLVFAPVARSRSENRIENRIEAPPVGGGTPDKQLATNASVPWGRVQRSVVAKAPPQGPHRDRTPEPCAVRNTRLFRCRTLSTETIHATSRIRRTHIGIGRGGGIDAIAADPTPSPPPRAKVLDIHASHTDIELTRHRNNTCAHSQWLNCS